MCLYVCMYVFINLYMYVFIYLLFIFDMQIYLFLSYWFVSTYCMNYIFIHVCACARAHTWIHPEGRRWNEMKWDEMSRHMWLPCIQHDLANLPGHVPQSLTVIILASPGLGAARNLRGRKRSTRRRKSLRWLSLSCKLALSAAVNHMNVSECCNAKFSDMMISYDLVW